MKIIRQGKRPEERLMRGTCSHCDTEIECTKGEATTDGDGGYMYSCPICSLSIGLRFYESREDQIY